MNTDTIMINNEEWLVVDEINIDDIRYVYLVQDKDLTNFCIKKINYINGMEYIVNLDTKDEFDKAIMKFNEKNHE